MGYSHSPQLADLYLHCHESPVVPRHIHIPLFKRYLDDILVVLRPTRTGPNAAALLSALARDLAELSCLTFEEEPPGPTLNFLDLTLTLTNGALVTRPYEKPHNLFLYPTAHSAQPKGLLKGLIWGRLLAYHTHCTYRADFLHAADNLLHRLIARGHCPRLTKKLIKKRTEELCSQAPAAEPNWPAKKTKSARDQARKLYFKIPYDPNGPDRRQLRHLLHLNHIERQLSHNTGTPITCHICYTTAPSLHQLLHFHQLPQRPTHLNSPTHTTHSPHTSSDRTHSHPPSS